ncbi:hypothetical protein [Caenispirillum bisanense]|uniref:Uncharacterized protein n=1 Tax=Caenispirillum bisanense TaxID=414052 RepID=A0A286GS41_9PROT|nr:hypothetical protein [Caenispirillum bisanense]SOD97879.1 hypothetical protein SAMN05421508_107114 [Caenispirillum bisanense]
MTLSALLPAAAGPLLPARQKTAPASTTAAAATPAAAPAAPPVGLSPAALTAMREDFLSRRLETAEKIMEAMRPYLSLVTTPQTARPMAATLGHVAREINAVVREMGGELARRTVADLRQPMAPAPAAADGAAGEKAKRFAGLASLADRAERAMSGASRMLRHVGSVYDPDPLGRGTVLKVAVDASRPLLAAWDDLKSFRLRLTAAENRVNLSA